MLRDEEKVRNDVEASCALPMPNGDLLAFVVTEGRRAFVRYDRTGASRTVLVTDLTDCMDMQRHGESVYVLFWCTLWRLVGSAIEQVPLDVEVDAFLVLADGSLLVFSGPNVRRVASS